MSELLRSPKFIVPAAILVSGLLIWWQSGGPPQEQIKNALNECTESFSEAYPRGVIRHFSDDYSDEKSRLDRAGLRQVLVGSSLRHRDSEGRFFYSAALEPGSLKIEVDPGHESATATFCLIFTKVIDESSAPAWKLEVETDWRREGSRWRVLRSDWRTLLGRPIF